jgi:hypothetical protein
MTFMAPALKEVSPNLLFVFNFVTPEICMRPKKKQILGEESKKVHSSFNSILSSWILSAVLRLSSSWKEEDKL